MAVIETKYSIGDVVYFASTTMERKQHPCPDCKGERKWKAVSPAGEEYEFRCPRCSASYSSRDDLSLNYTAHTPIATRLTIGSVRHDSNGSHPNHTPKNEYMCRETGVGSGSVYNEDRLFPTEAEALEFAKGFAGEANANTEWIVKLYDRALEMSDYEFSNAALKSADRARLRAQEMLYNLSALFSAIEEADDKDAILEAIEQYKEWDWARDKAKAIEARQGGNGEAGAVEDESAVPARNSP